MACSAGDQLLVNGFDAVLHKIQVSILQITKKWNEKWLPNIKNTFTIKFLQQKPILYQRIPISKDGLSRSG